MFIPRIIPVLLLKDKGLVKTVKFDNAKYIGDPINAVRIFNDLKSDELIFLDIMASRENRTVPIEIVRNIGDEAFMPFGVGGGIRTIGQIEELLKAGAEKVVINTQFIQNPKIIEESVRYFGSQSIVVSIDVKKSFTGKYRVFIKNGREKTEFNPVEAAKKAEDLGAGEIIINSIDRDGMMIGYDIGLLKIIVDEVSIPTVACGGAGNLQHLKDGYFEGKSHALAAGSIFVYHGARKAVLINYPTREEIKSLFTREVI